MWVIWFCCSWVCVFVVVFCLYTCLANAWRDCCHDWMEMCESETAMIKSLWSLEHRSALPMVIFILTIFVRVLRLSVDVIKTGLGLFQGRLPVQSQSHQLKAHRHVHQSFEITEESFHWRWEKTFICQLYFCVNIICVAYFGLSSQCLQLEIRKHAQIFRCSIQIGCLDQTWGIFCVNTPEVPPPKSP